MPHHQDFVKRITENDRLITMTQIEKKYMKNMKNAPSTIMNQTMQDCSSIKNVVDSSKQKQMMQATSTTGWFGHKKGLGDHLKNTDFEDLIHPNRQAKKTQAMTNTYIEDGESTARNSIFNSTSYPFTKQ